MVICDDERNKLNILILVSFFAQGDCRGQLCSYMSFSTRGRYGRRAFLLHGKLSAVNMEGMQRKELCPMYDDPRRFEARAFLLLLAAATILFGWLVFPFFDVVFWAAVIAVLFGPGAASKPCLGVDSLALPAGHHPPSGLAPVFLPAGSGRPV